jgi:hypothetical protein
MSNDKSTKNLKEIRTKLFKLSSVEVRGANTLNISNASDCEEENIKSHVIVPEYPKKSKIEKSSDFLKKFCTKPKKIKFEYDDLFSHIIGHSRQVSEAFTRRTTDCTNYNDDYFENLDHINENLNDSQLSITSNNYTEWSNFDSDYSDDDMEVAVVGQSTTKPIVHIDIKLIKCETDDISGC